MDFVIIFNYFYNYFITYALPEAKLCVSEAEVNSIKTIKTKKAIEDFLKVLSCAGKRRNANLGRGFCLYFNFFVFLSKFGFV